MSLPIGPPELTTEYAATNWLGSLYRWIISKESSDGINFLQDLSSASPRTVQDKLRDVVHIKDCGVTGSGDETTAIQAAITDCAGKMLDFGGSENTYTITASLTIPSNTYLFGSGAIIDASGMTGTKHALVCAGSLGTNAAITTADIGSYTVAVTSADAFAAEDFVLLTSDDHYSYTTQDSDFGEVLQVRSIDGTDIYFATPLNYTFSTTPVLRAVTWKENVVIDGLDIRGPNAAASAARGICLRYVKNFSIRNCKISGIDHYGIEINSSINGEVRSNFIKGVFYNGVTGTIFYGIIVMNCSQYVNVANNVGHKNRHLVVTTANSGGGGYYGQPLFIDVGKNIFHDAEAGAGGRSFAYENHGFGRFIVWHDNIANGCYSGFRIENGSNNLVVNNIIRNYAYSGILLGGRGQGAFNLSVTNNEISGMTDEISGSAAILIEEGQILTVSIDNGGSDYVTGDTITLVQAGASGATFSVTATAGVVTGVVQRSNGKGYTTDTGLTTSGGTGTGCTLDISSIAYITYNNLAIKNNIIRDPNNSTSDENGIRIEDNTYNNTVLEGNQINDTTDNQLYAIYCTAGADNLMIANNKTYGYRAGVAVYGDRCVVRGNMISNDSAKADGYGIFSDGLKNVIQNNTLTYINTALRLGANSNTNLCVNNQAVDCTTGSVSDAGTDNTSRDNDAI